MTGIIEYKLMNYPNVKIRVESEDIPRDYEGIQRTVGIADKPVLAAKKTFAAALEEVKILCDEVVTVFKKLTTNPKTLQLKFGVLAELEGSFKIIKGSGAANFEVSLTWEYD